MQPIGITMTLFGLLLIVFGVLVAVEPRILVMLVSALFLFFGSLVMVLGIGVWKFQHKIVRMRERFVGVWRR